MPRLPSPVLRTACAMVLGLFALAGGAPAAGAASLADPSCTIVWTGATDGAWGEAGNWQVVADGSGAVPTTADVACIGPTASGRQPTAPAGVDVDRLVVGDGGGASLDVSGGGITAPGGVVVITTSSLRVVGGISAGALDVDGGVSLTLADGTIAVPLTVPVNTTLTITGATTFAQGITVSGTVQQSGGDVTVPAGQALGLGGTWSAGGDRVTVNGSFTLGGIQTGDARVGASGRLTYNGPADSNVIVASGGEIAGNVPAGSALRVQGTPAVAGAWANAGTLVLDNATLGGALTALASTGAIQVDGTAAIGVPFTNAGSITGAAGLTVDGALTVATGSAMDGVVTVNGSLAHDGGTSNVSLAGTLLGSIPAGNRVVARDVTGPGDAWTNAGTIAFTGTGGRLAAAGALTSAGAITVAGGGHRLDTLLVNHGTLTLGGAIALSKGLSNTGTVGVSAAASVAGGLVQEAGSFAVNGGGSVTVTGGLRVAGGTLANSGAVDVDAGTTFIEGGATTGGAIRAAGPVEYSAGASTSSRVDRVGAAAAVSGTMPAGHVLTVKAPTTVTGTFIANGTLDVAAGATLSGGAGIQSGGTTTVGGTVSTPITNVGTLTVDGTVGAAVSSSGTLTLNQGATIALGGGTLTSSGPFLVRGTVSGGTAAITGGTTALFATGKLPNTTVALPARLRGEGDVQALTNNGTVEPVDPANGTGAVLQASSYSQALTAELDAVPGARVQVSGNAALNGRLNINNYVPPGAPACGTAATYLTAGGAISGGWSTVTPATFTGGRFFARVTPGTPSSAGVRTIRVPGAPTLSVSGADQALEVGIGAPSTDGCSPITRYLATLTPAGGSAFERDVVNAAVTGLPNQVTYTVSLQAVNDAGAGAYSAPRTAKTNAAPSAVIAVSPAQPRPGEPATLTASVADDGPAPPTLRWDADGNGTFNDGTQTITTFTYARAGTYSAKLQVTDSDGVTTLVSKTVVVSADPQPVPTPAPTPVPTAEPTAVPTVQATPTPAPTAGPDQVDPADPRLDLRLPKAGLRQTRSGTVPIALANRNAFAVTAKVTIRPRRTRATAAVFASYGTRTVTLKARRRAVVEVKVKKAARALLRRKKRLRTTVFVTLTGPAGSPVTVTGRAILRAPKR